MQKASDKYFVDYIPSVYNIAENVIIHTLGCTKKWKKSYVKSYFVVPCLYTIDQYVNIIFYKIKLGS